MLLIASGFLDAVSNDDFNTRIYDAITNFQTQNGFARTGMIGGVELGRVQALADPHLGRWQLERIVHPETGSGLWVPMGLNLKAERDKFGLSFNGGGNVEISFKYFPGLALASSYQNAIAAFQSLAAKGVTLNYQVARSDFYVIQGYGPDVELYWRYHSFGSGVIGYSMIWRPSAIPDGASLNTLMSDLFRASYTQRLERAPPPPTTRTARASQASHPPTPQTQSEEPPTSSASSGTGFFVSSAGHVLTNSHVVEGCSQVQIVHENDAPVQARVAARDAVNDLALLQTLAVPRAVAPLRTGPKVGESIAVFGFPLAGLLASSGNFTVGNITATAGLRDDSRMLQISAPIQPGNSGGPVLDLFGNVVGVVVSKLDALKYAEVSKDVAQNINFSIKTAVAINFLETNSIAFNSRRSDKQLAPAEIADQARSFTVYIECKK